MFAPKSPFSRNRTTGWRLEPEEPEVPRDPDDDSEDSWKHILKVAVITAGLTAIAEGLGEWVVHELKNKFGTKKNPSQTPKDSSENPSDSDPSAS